MKLHHAEVSRRRVLSSSSETNLQIRELVPQPRQVPSSTKPARTRLRESTTKISSSYSHLFCPFPPGIADCTWRRLHSGLEPVIPLLRLRNLRKASESHSLRPSSHGMFNEGPFCQKVCTRIGSGKTSGVRSVFQYAFYFSFLLWADHVVSTS